MRNADCRRRSKGVGIRLSVYPFCLIGDHRCLAPVIIIDGPAFSAYITDES